MTQRAEGSARPAPGRFSLARGLWRCSRGAAITGCTAAIVLLTGGCTWLQNDAERGVRQVPHWRSDTEGVIATTADVRLVTRRRRPNTNEIVTCTEPSPDVAKALSTVGQLTAKGGKGPATGELDGSLSSAEAVAELAGRSTALLALRDGLFRTCEAYANGVLGADAYALVLARYGQLMTTLFLGQDISGGMPSALASVGAPKTPSGSPPATSDAGTNDSGGKGGADSGGTPEKSTTSNAAGSAAPAPGLGPVGAAALARMNEDYDDLDQNLVPLLLVACVNHTDPTRSAVLEEGGSRADASWLTQFCNAMSRPEVLLDFAARAGAVERSLGHPAKAIDLVAVANPSMADSGASVVAKGNSAKGDSTASPPAPGATARKRLVGHSGTVDDNVRIAQAELAAEGYVLDKVDGVLGAQTRRALDHYQSNNSLVVTGEADQATLRRLAMDQQRLISAKNNEVVQKQR